jgi:hypothetical protein
MAPASASEETAIVVVVPEIEPVVGEWRMALDPSAPLGVPAHVTILYPFVPRRAVGHRDLARLAEIAEGESPFTATFSEVGWFGEDVVYATPHPRERFRGLIRRVAAAWPQHPPYRGLHPDPTPHLTIGDRGSIEEMRAAGHEVAARLPVTSQVTRLTLIEQVGGRWREAARFPLGQSSGESQS